MGAHNFCYHSQILSSIQLLPWIRCQAGLPAIGIKSDGSILDCLSFPDIFIEGKIHERNIIDIWNDSTLFSYNRNFTKEKLNGECNNCRYGKQCRGGCQTVSPSLTGQNHSGPYFFH